MTLTEIMSFEGFSRAYWIYAYPGDRVALRRLAIKSGL